MGLSREFWIGTGIAVFFGFIAIAAALIDLRPRTKKIVAGICGALALVGLLIAIVNLPVTWQLPMTFQWPIRLTAKPSADVDATGGFLAPTFVLLFAVAAVVLYRQYGRPKESFFAKYLLGLAQSDSREMWQRIHFNWGSAQAIASLNAVEPYVHLIVGVVNATVFELTIDHVEEHIYYGGHPLHDAPEIVRSPGVSSVPHAQVGSIRLRQNLLPETARKMRDELPVTLSTGHMAIFLRYTDENGENRFVRIAFPDAIFVIDKIY